MEDRTRSCRSLQDNMYSAFGTFNRAASLRVLLTHGTCMCYKLSKDSYM